MCEPPMVCHGDKHEHLEYSEEQKKLFKTDCKPATFYLSTDGKYAIDADFVDLDKLDSLDEETIKSLPKMTLKKDI